MISGSGGAQAKIRWRLDDGVQLTATGRAEAPDRAPVSRGRGRRLGRDAHSTHIGR